MSRPAPKKSIKLISHFRKIPQNVKFENVTNQVLDSTTESIEILNGSFSTVKPIGFPKTFALPHTSTPIYEDISEPEEIMGNVESNSESDIFENEIDPNLTYNYEDDIVTQKKNTEVYLKKVEAFLADSAEMVNEKMAKRDNLFKKINKYKRKLHKLEKAVNELDKLIMFGKRLPRLMELEN